MNDTIEAGHEPGNAEQCFERGMIYSTGRDGAVDMISAHMWFNIAASRGHADAVQLRREVAAQMTDAEIGQAQRRARDWLKAHPLPAVVEIRKAA
ncbi:MAG: sel1 repeat family protein [Pseudolabrys sp.]|nr:sel1 repeat family protein [Pseudolabrys sp.]MBV9953707.1 sel1 repeat family protein [Pseudolabrys sp.]